MNLNRAISLAIEEHNNQLDKNGEPYILHLIRVMLKMDTEDERIVAVLHDVVEDGELTIGDLYAFGFEDHIVEAIDVLTRCRDELYKDFIFRISQNKLATKVKLADLSDNTDPKRINKNTKHLQKRYIEAIDFLLHKK